MRRISLFVLISWFALATASCRSGSPSQPGPKAPEPAAASARAADSAASGEETCPVADPSTSPPTCPENCYWNGTACKVHRGVILEERKGTP